ncbi:RNA polymerase sigma factor [Arcticibacter eurypsychrophilus]|uniref:RNA polymerase sigma factor n=1 Tax=Arcticibacter eurypsychrophilus TaxID=1434752 RepID=UPI00084DAD33|nr:sigma-70 family RNA polymerase sigma factor [Arcticibacter eurypsychrophilus]
MIYSEKELTRGIANGDQRAFTVFYKQNVDNLHRYLHLYTKSKEAVEETIQHVFMKIWERRETLEDIASLKAYVFRSSKNCFLDKMRRNKVETKVFILIHPGHVESDEHSDTKIICDQNNKLLYDAINLLPKKRKQIVNFRIIEELTLDEIAEKLAISKFVVKKQLYKGMKLIRTYLLKRAELNGLN